MTEDQTLQEIRTAAYLAALCAGSEVYFYWGDDKASLRERVAFGEIGMIGANLDTEVFWLNPKAFPELHGRLREDIGWVDLHFIGGE